MGVIWQWELSDTGFKQLFNAWAKDVENTSGKLEALKKNQM